LRQDYQQFKDRDCELFAIGPDSSEKMQQHWEKEELPYPGIPDPGKDVLEALGQEFKLLKFGRMPAVVIVGDDGEIHYAHYGSNAGDIPPNEEVLSIVDGIASK
jgi:mycoredoxin-dependent peroxiredoxin